MNSELIFGILQNSLEEGSKEGARLAWSILKSIFIERWLLIMGLLFLLFVIATTEAFMGYWGRLGSLLYNTLYFGVIIIAILIWGPEIIVSNIFGAIAIVVLYPTCYYISGVILRKLGFDIRRRNPHDFKFRI